MPDIMHLLRIAVPTERVYEALTTADGIRNWWTRDADLERGTTLSFAHCGFPKGDDEYAMCTTGWGYYLVSLQQYLQTGKGAPSPDVDFGRVIGP